MRRIRWVYWLCLTGVIVAGLGSRSELARHLPEFFGAFAGDTLWALALYLFLGSVYLQWGTGRLAAVSLGLAFSVEVSQLYHAPWIDYIRGTLPGRLLLGSGFMWSDLACYSAGIGLGVLTEYFCQLCLRGSERAEES